MTTPISELVGKIIPLQDKLKSLKGEIAALNGSLAALKKEYVEEFEGKFIGKSGDRVFLVVVCENTISDVEEVEKFEEFDRGDS